MSEEAYANDALRETWLDNNMIHSVFSLPAFSYLLNVECPRLVFSWNFPLEHIMGNLSMILTGKCHK